MRNSDYTIKLVNNQLYLLYNMSSGRQSPAQAVQNPDRKDYQVHDTNNEEFDQHADKVVEPFHKITFPDICETFPDELYLYVRYVYFHQFYLLL